MLLVFLQLGSQVGEFQHYYVSPGSYLWTQGLHNCVYVYCEYGPIQMYITGQVVQTLSAT